MAYVYVQYNFMDIDTVSFLPYYIKKFPQEDFICFYPGEMKMLRTNHDLTFLSEVIVLKKE